MSTRLITINDTPIRAAHVHGFASALANHHEKRQEISITRLAGPAKMGDRICVGILVRQEGSNDGQYIVLTRTQAEILRDVLTENIINY